MTWLVPVLYGLSAVATVLAWLVARRKPEHVPAALLLSVGLGCDVLRRILTRAVLNPEVERIGSAPFTGWVRAVAHVDDALFLAWPAALAGAAVVVFLGRRVWPVLAVYLASLLTIIIAYPLTRGGLLARAYAASELVALLVAVGCFATWYLGPSRKPTTTAQAVVTVIAASELATLVGAWRIGVFDNWHLTQIVYALMYSVLILMQGGFLWQSRSS